MATAKTESQLPMAMATKPVLPPIQDSIQENHRYRGYIYDLRQPRYPITGPITSRSDINRKKFPLPRSLVNGRPVCALTPPQGFQLGSDQVRDISAEERNENKINLRLLDKNSAELRKSQQAQQDRLEFMNTHQKRKEEQVKKNQEEREQDLKQLKEYNPFGKPGYGAPRGTGKDKTAISKALRTSWGVGHVDVQAGEAMDKPRTELPPMYVKPKIRRYEDDRMRRYGVNAETAAQYKKDLDEHQLFRRNAEQKIKELDKEREDAMMKYDPFGKPGAGAPNRDAQGNVKVGRKFVPKENNPTENAKIYDPWGKDMRRKDKDGNIIKLPRTGDHGIYEFVDPNVPNHSFPRKHLGGGGEPLLKKNGGVQTKRPGLLTTIHGARRTENITKVATPEEVKRKENTSPWGRPGAGAPLTDSEGMIVKNTKGRIHQEALGMSDVEATRAMKAKTLYRKELQEGMVMQKQLRNIEKEYQLKPPGDVPSWFSKGQVGRPRRDPETGLIVPQKRIMSDVTAQKLAKNRPRDVEGYYRELDDIAQDRKRKRMIENDKRAKLEAKPFPYRVVAPWAVDTGEAV